MFQGCARLIEQRAATVPIQYRNNAKLQVAGSWSFDVAETKHGGQINSSEDLIPFQQECIEE
jgi:hypothetical protein